MGMINEGKDRDAEARFIRLRLSDGNLLVVTRRFWEDFIFNRLDTRKGRYFFAWGIK